MTTITKSELDAIIAAACKNAIAEYVRESGALAPAAPAPAKQGKTAKQGKKDKKQVMVIPTKQYNATYDGHELVFPVGDGERPADALTAAVKKYGLRWNKKTGVWYTRSKEAAICALDECKILVNAAAAAPAAPAPAPAAPAPAPVVNRIPKDAPKAQAAAGPLAVGQCFILDRDFPGLEKVYKIVSFPADDKVKVKYDDGKTAVHKLQKTEYGTYFITVNKRRAPLVG